MDADLVLLLAIPLACGLLASMARLPPLVGFLIAGFLLTAIGVVPPGLLDTLADLGVTLLLFGIGLKLDARVLLRREVWLTTTVHLAVTVPIAGSFLAVLGLAGVQMVADESIHTLAIIGLALAFSSTVLVVKLLESQSSTSSLYGRTAVGVLVIQDLVAVVFLAASEAEPPSPWALALVLLLPAAWVARRLQRRLGHGELPPLYAVVLALVPGYALFEAVGLKGDLGALVVGMLLAGAPGSGELGKAIFSIKELLLVAFFVSIGLAGLPTMENLLVSAALLLLLPLKAAGFAVLLWAQGLRPRTAALTGTTLGNYSEFGLIVLAVATSAGLLEQEWLVVLSTAVAASFVLSAVLARRDDPLVEVAGRVLPERAADRLHADDRPIEVGHADAVVLGMGRVGSAAYQQLTDAWGLRVVGVEEDPHKVEALRAAGMDVVEGDATDPTFWSRITAEGEVRLALLAMPFHGTNLETLERLEASKFQGTVAVIAQFDDEAAEVARHVDTVFGIYDGAGTSLADRGARAAGLGPGPGPSVEDQV